MTEPTQNEVSKRQSRFSPRLILWLVYCLILGITLLRHELWRDELTAYAIARDAESLSAMLQHLPYDRHPPLWHLALYVGCRIWPSPYVMQVFSFAIAASIAWLLLFRMSLPKVLRYTLPFSYLILYEYAAISRGYGLTVLVFLLLIDTWDKHLAGNPYECFYLVMLPMVTGMGWILAVWYVGLRLGLMVWYRRQSTFAPQSRLRAAVWLLVSVAGIGTAYMFLSPSHEVSSPLFQNEMRLYLSSGQLTTCWWAWLDGMAPIKPWILSFWPYSLAYHPAVAAVGVVMAALMLFVLLPRWELIIGVILGWLMFLAAIYLKGPESVSTRHAGFMFVLWLGALCLVEKAPNSQLVSKPTDDPKTGWRFRACLVIGLFHLALAVWPIQTDWRYPFSDSGRLAGKLRQANLQNAFMIGLVDYLTTPFAVWLDRPIYQFNGGYFNTFTDYGQSKATFTADDFTIGLPQHEMVMFAINQAVETRQPVVILGVQVLDGFLADIRLPPGLTIGSIHTQQRPIMLDEAYHIYVFSYNPPADEAAP